MKRYTDAEFEVVSGPMRLGDPHPVRKRWVFSGLIDRHGNPLWYRPPRFNRWQLFGIGLAALLLFRVIYFSALSVLHHWRP